MQNSAFLRVISPTKEIAVTSDNDDELAVLTREIADKVTYVQSQTRFLSETDTMYPTMRES